MTEVLSRSRGAAAVLGGAVVGAIMSFIAWEHVDTWPSFVLVDLVIAAVIAALVSRPRSRLVGVGVLIGVAVLGVVVFSQGSPVSNF